MPPVTTPLLLQDLAPGPIVFLTGAGISAESGVPTFRGPEGYWRIGSRNYRPMELATRAAFGAMPEDVWRWYLHRRAICRAAQPNPAHLALARAAAGLGERCLLVTQNVDGLHRRAGSPAAGTYEIHGNIDQHRCAGACESPPLALPAELGTGGPGGLSPEERALLTCGCGAWRRPHVLWFDESYDERSFRYESTLDAMDEAAALVVIGTSGATGLPTRMVEVAVARDLPLVVIDREPTAFSALAEASPRGLFLQGTAGALVPALVAGITQAGSSEPSG